MKYGEPHSMEEWVKFYKSKTHDAVDVPQGFSVTFLPTRGFMVTKPDIEGSMLMVYIVCGDGAFWHDVAELLAINNGLRYLTTICTRHIEPYIRLWGWKILTKGDINNQKRYVCIDKQGRYIVATHRGEDVKTGEPSYWVTKYLIKGEKPDV